MADETKYGGYIVRRPIHEVLANEEGAEEAAPRGRTRTMTYMSHPLVAGAPAHMLYMWVHEVPDPNPYVVEHEHPYDEILFFMGSNPDDLTDLGAVVEIALGGETHVIDTVASVYIPAGLRHCPITYKSVTRPHTFVAISLSGRYITDEGREGASRYVSPDLAPA